ncbi:MAG: hypothetical protein U9Q37_07185 [Euryarchaeota archaeon]|nr:hypothetical protein [Euryarchaeota archaeon]
MPHQEDFRLTSDMFQIPELFSFPQLLPEILVVVFYCTVHPWLAWCDKYGFDTDVEAKPHDTAEIP